MMKCKKFVFGLWAICYSQLGVAATQLPDSLLTFEKAYYYNIVDMPKSLQIVQTMRERKMAQSWELDRAEANLWSLDHQYNKALKLYQKVLKNPKAVESWEEELRTLFFITYCYDKLRDERHLSEMGFRMKELAEKYQAATYLSMTEFLRGKRLYAMGRWGEGCSICERAVEAMKRVSYRYKNRMLFIFNANLSNMYLNNGKYQEASKTLSNAEEVLRQGLNMNVLDVERRASSTVYATKARILAAEGQLAQADSVYALMRSNPYRDIGAEVIILPYLKMREKYTDMLESTKYCRKVIESDDNQIGMNMISILRFEIEAYMGLKEFQKASEDYYALTKMTDSLHIDNMNYFSKEARANLRREQLVARQNLQLSIGISALIILSLLMLAAFVHHLQTRKRTKVMKATIDELMFYRNLFLQNGDNVPVEMDENETTSYEEKHRFKEMDKRIMKEKLFCSPEFGRDDLMRLMGVDKNAIAHIVQKYAHTNVSGYIKMKRMEYAVTLLKEHPELTIAAIADYVGIKSTTTFVNHFKDTFGITPSDYRNTDFNSAPPSR